MTKLDQLKAQKAALEAEIKLVEKEEAEIAKRLDKSLIELAETLHDMDCRWNHNDGCSWFYEDWKDVNLTDYRAKSDYYNKAEKLREFCMQYGFAYKFGLAGFLRDLKSALA